MAIERPKLKLHRGSTYVFDVSDPSLASHPLRFTNDSGTTEYTSGVTAAGNAGSPNSTVTFAVPISAPSNLMYYCGTHGIGMGNKIKIIDDPDNEIAWGGARGFFTGGTTGGYTNRTDDIEYIAIATPGNAQDFGDLVVARWSTQGTSNGTRGVIIGGRSTSNTALNNIDYITCATLGNAQDFGDLLVGRHENSSAGNGTRALSFNGKEDVAGRVDTIEYITIATTGNAIDFGNTLAVKSGQTAVNGETRALVAGSYDWATNDIEYVTVDTPGNSIDFGDLTDNSTGGGSAADKTRGLIALGSNTNQTPIETDKIDYVTHATLGNATSFGLLTDGRHQQPSGCSDGIYACFGPAYDQGNSVNLNIIDRVTIQTVGNATDFGDLLSAKKEVGALSGAAA